MIETPVFRPSFHVAPVEDEGVVLLSEQAQFVLKGRLYSHLAPLLDGSHTADDIVDRLSGLAAPAEVYYALIQLEKNGYIVHADSTIAPGRAAFWDALGLNAQVAERRLRDTAVRVRVLLDLSREPFASAFTALGIALDEASAVSVVLTDDYLHPDLRSFNAEALASGHPWLLAKPVGTVIWIGPVFRPHHTACWECLAQRLRLNREVETSLQQRGTDPKPFRTSRAALPSAVQTASGMIATEIAKWIARGEQYDGHSSVTTLDLITLQAEEHRLIRRPQCPSCGRSHQASQCGGRVLLRSQKKQFTGEGGHRTATPEQTLSRYGHHVSSITGAVPALGAVSLIEAPSIYVYSAGHNLAMRPDAEYPYPLRRGFRSRSAGKGLTDSQAKASGLCEALERYCGCFQGDERVETGSFKRLAGTAIHPNACMLFSERQYRERHDTNARDSNFATVPAPFDEDTEIDWTPLWSLTKQEPRHLPTSYLYYRYPIRRDAFFCWSDSNGNAAGNTLEEAILQGFLELVERDSVAIWWYNRIRRPAVSLDDVDDPYIQNLRRQYRTLGRELWLLDLTTDLRIPSYAAVSRKVDSADEQIILGFGAHFNARIAISRAMAELNQSAVFIHGTEALGDGVEIDRDVQNWLRTANIANQPYLAPDDSAPQTRIQADHRWSDDLRDDVLRCQRIAERHGMEMLVLDQTRPDIELPVAKVIVPGLRHFWARFAPGRLYDVPVKLGWLSQPLREEQLNPIAVFF